MTADRQAAMLDRLRAKGLGLAPHMVDGKVTPRGSGKRPAGNGAGRGRSAPQPPSDTSTHPDETRPADRHTAPGTVFEFTIPAPCEFLNANQRLHHMAKAKRVKAWRFGACLTAAHASAPQGIGRLRIDAYVIKPVANRYDPANYQDTAKACMDGLIDYGMAADDNRKIVDGPFMHDGGRGEPGLRIVVTVLA